MARPPQPTNQRKGIARAKPQPHNPTKRNTNKQTTDQLQGIKKVSHPVQEKRNPQKTADRFRAGGTSTMY